MDDGLRVPKSTRISEAMSADLDAVRGDMDDSEALRAALGYWIAARKRALRSQPPATRNRRPAPVAAESARERARGQVEADTSPAPALKVPFSSGERQ